MTVTIQTLVEEEMVLADSVQLEEVQPNFSHYTTTCFDCEAGKYMPNEGKYICGCCPQGYYQPYTGKSSW
jgi:hypothetical protein